MARTGGVNSCTPENKKVTLNKKNKKGYKYFICIMFISFGIPKVFNPFYEYG